MLYKKVPQAEQIKNAKCQLACEKSPEIALDPEDGNCPEDENQADQQADHVQRKDVACHAETLQDAGQGGVQIEKRTDEAQRCDKIAGQRTVKQGASRPLPTEHKDTETGKTHKPAVFDRFYRVFLHGIDIPQSIALRDHGEQEDGHGACQGVGEKDKGHRHSGENAVNA